MQTWDAGLYQSAHSFVWEYGRDLLGLLAPMAGERILDVGCGSGNLTAEIAKSCQVVGVDSSMEMICQARINFPQLQFVLRDVRELAFAGEFDAVFSNAALHWVRESQQAADGMAQALKPAGRLVAEFGGKGNVAAVLDAIYRALQHVGVRDPAGLNCWYFPSVDTYTEVLERSGLRVSYAALFDRPTLLEGGIDNWVRQFGGMFTAAVPKQADAEFWAKLREFAAPALLRDGVWQADYRRLRVVAAKS